MKQKLFLIIRGLPGAGKSTFAIEQYNLYTSIGIDVAGPFEADQFFQTPEGYVFNPAKLGNAHAQCFSNTENAMKNSASVVIVSNTFTTEKEVQPYLELANKYEYKTVSLVVENRHGSRSVHNVPEESLTKMKNRFSLKLL